MNHAAAKERLLRNPEVRCAYEHPPFRLAIAFAVIDARRTHGMSQEDLARRLGTSQNQVWRIESGAANLNLKTLENLHEVLGIEFCVQEPRRPARPRRFRQHRPQQIQLS